MKKKKTPSRLFAFFLATTLVLLLTISGSVAADPRRRFRTEARLHNGGARPRAACPFYVWNAPSALFHKWCQHLMKDHIYEGRGGVKVSLVGLRGRWA